MRTALTLLCITLAPIVMYGESAPEEIRLGRDARGEPEDERRGSKVRNFIPQLNSIPGEELSIEHLPEGYEERVIAELWRRGDYPKLIAMGSEEAMEAFVEELVATEAKHLAYPRSIGRTHSPHFIKHLGPLLFLDDHYGSRRVGPGIGFDSGFTVTIADGISSIIRRSSKFSDELKEWFQTGRYRSGPDPIGRIRQWWKENEEHFENEHYHLVRPLLADLQEREQNPNDAGIDEDDTGARPPGDASANDMDH